MCGIVGLWNRKQAGDKERAGILRGMERLRHRGPDGDGLHFDGKAGLGMGHTRLSIIDLEGGDQPLYDETRSVVLTVNGEFYDYKPIRADLSTRGHRFRSKSDSEIAIHLYKRFGTEFVHHLRGEFAFALFDAERQRLILVRDRFGIKPLYFHVSKDRFVYGSEVKAILEQDGVDARLCRKAALNQLMQTMVPGTTAFEGVHSVRPGHMLIVEKREDGFEVSDECYWDFLFPEEGEYETDRPARYFVDGVRDRLIDAVRVRLEADVPVGCYLSGGIDSCSMLGLATPLQQSPVKAYTISFDDDEYDEASIAREMARSVGADHDVLNLGAKHLYGESFARTVWHSERTFYNTLGVAKWQMSRRVRESGFKVVVTGEGADELFAGYPFFKRDYFISQGDDAMSPEFGGLFDGAILPERTVSHPAFEELCGFTPSWVQPWMLTLERVTPLLSDAMRDEIGDYDPVQAVAEQIDPAAVHGRTHLDIAQYTWSKTMLEGQILTWGGDRVDMANSMESRPAFLDHHLAEFAATIPPHYRIKDGVEKWVLREAMKGVLPKALYERPKFPFMAPPSHTNDQKQEAVSNLAEAWLSSDRLAEAGLFDAEAVNGFLTNRGAGSELEEARRNDIILNHLICLQLLDDQFVRRPADAPAVGAA